MIDVEWDIPDLPDNNISITRLYVHKKSFSFYVARESKSLISSEA